MPMPDQQSYLIMERPRIEYDLQKNGDLIFSNSPTSNEDSVVKIDGGGVLLKLGYLVRNTSNQNLVLKAENLSLQLNDEKLSPLCFFNGIRASDLNMSPQQKIIISCEINLFPNGQNKLRTRDTKAQFTINYGKKEQITSSILLRIEDFE